MTGVERAFQYCEDVNKKRIVTNQYVKLAVKRFLNDLEKSKKEDAEFYFDEEAANHIIAFAEATKQYNDVWRGKLLHLEPWQCFIFANVYGWKRKEDNKRRYRKAYIQVGRKAGKSTMIAVLLLYDLLTTNGSQAYCACTKRDTAKIIFNCCKQAVLQNEALQKRLKIYNSTCRITNEGKAGFLEALAADADRMDGLNPSVCCIDEIGSMKDFDIVKRLQSGQGSRPEPLIFEIGSATDDMYSAGRQEFERADKILKGTAFDDTFFCIMYCLDEKDNWTDESTYIKANPNMGVSMNAEFLHNLKVEAVQQPGLEGEFRTRNLGQWISPVHVWIPYQTWDNCVVNAGKYSLSEEEKKNCLIIGAVDLSKRYDFSTYTKYFFSPKQKMFFAEHKMYFPEEQIENKMQHDSPMIRKWIELGYITPTHGSIVDYNAIFKDIKDDLDKYDIREILYDPYNAATLMTEIGPLVDLVEVNQSMKNMSPMAKDWEAAVINKEIVDGNPVMKWMVSCCSIYKDPNENIKPVKDGDRSGSKRIDAVITSLMCFGRMKNLLDTGEYDARTPEEIQAEMERKLSILEY